MYKKIANSLYILNTLFQALYCLGLPIGLAALASYLLTEYASFPGWIWALLITLGVMVGLYSMVKFILVSMKSFERLQKEREKTATELEEKLNRQKELRDAAKNKESEEDSNE